MFRYFASCALAALLIWGTTNAAMADSKFAQLRVAGRAQSVVSADQFNCAPPSNLATYHDVPDGAPHAYRDTSGNLHLFANTFLGYRLAGRDFNDIEHPDCSRMMISGLSSDPSRFRNHEWLISPYTLDGQHVYALVHDEYFGWDYDHGCARPAGAAKHCWYIAISAAWSGDGGNTFGPPPAGYGKLVATLPYGFSNDMAVAGYGNPTNIFRNPHDGLYYALIGAFGYRAQKSGRCLIRTADFRSWNFWTGKDFSGKFVDPYEKKADAGAGGGAAGGICTPVYSGSLVSIVYSPHLDLFVGVGGQHGGGFSYSSSQDLVHWADAQQLMAPGRSVSISYPSLIDENSKARNFDTTGNRPYLYFVQFDKHALGGAGAHREILRTPLILQEAN